MKSYLQYKKIEQLNESGVTNQLEEVIRDDIKNLLHLIIEKGQEYIDPTYLSTEYDAAKWLEIILRHKYTKNDK